MALIGLEIVCLIALMLLPADTPNISFFSFLEGFGYNDDCCKNMFRMFSFLACPDWVLLNFFPIFLCNDSV